MTLTPDERFDRLDDFIARGAILRGKWQTIENGREYACLLAALSPEVADSGDALACPADTIAPWFAHMLPSMDDRGSVAAWPAMIRRVAATVRRCHRWLQPEDWRRSDYAVRAAALREAMPFASHETKPALERVLALCDREANGDVVTESQWSEARDAAAAAWRAADAAVDAAADADADAAIWDRISAATLDILDAACAAREARKI